MSLTSSASKQFVPDPISRQSEPVKFQAITARNFDTIPQVQNLSDDDRFAIRVVSSVLPFRTNPYVVENLIDWDKVPEDPIYRLVFPQRGMLQEGRLRPNRRYSGAGEPAAGTGPRGRRNPRAAQSSPRGAAGTQYPERGRRSFRGTSAQVQRNGSVLPEPGTDPATPTAPFASAGRNSCKTKS